MSREKKISRRRARLRFILFLIVLCFVFLLGGFLKFVCKVENMVPASPMPVADGIVVWTGKGGDRLAAAGQLLDKGHGERLLISGVNKALTDADVYELLTIENAKGICCVDIDYKALDTIGNARETHNWLKALGYEHIILVTSSYHMPRAEIEIGALSGRVRITPYPVAYDPAGKWWKDKLRRQRLMQEYGKLLLTNLRRAGNDQQREAPELPDLPDKIEPENKPKPTDP